MSAIDSNRSRRPVKVTVPELFNKINHQVMIDRRSKKSEIASVIGILNE